MPDNLFDRIQREIHAASQLHCDLEWDYTFDCEFQPYVGSVIFSETLTIEAVGAPRGSQFYVLPMYRVYSLN